MYRTGPTADNLEAVELARMLLRRGGEGELRGDERRAADLLFTGREYLTPLQTIGAARAANPVVTGSEVQDLWERAIGRMW